MDLVMAVGKFVVKIMKNIHTVIPLNKKIKVLNLMGIRHHIKE